MNNGRSSHAPISVFTYNEIYTAQYLRGELCTTNTIFNRFVINPIFEYSFSNKIMVSGEKYTVEFGGPVLYTSGNKTFLLYTVRDGLPYNLLNGFRASEIILTVEITE